MEPSSLTDSSSNLPTESGLSSFANDHPPANPAIWDWADTLNFSIPYEEDCDLFPVPPNLPPLGVDFSPGPVLYEPTDRVRKRDPRLTCSNFLAGRVPCACPELDEQLQEEEGLLNKKRLRDASTWRGVVRCQVYGCEADISQLKGYHKRHKVCLSCANACSVVLDGETKRYCQQCGKFHVLQDFDEGRRSCRRKLERHNNRRRRKPHDSKDSVDTGLDKESLDTLTAGDENHIHENSSLSSQTIFEEAAFTEPVNREVALPGSNFEDVNIDNGLSFAASGDSRNIGGRAEHEKKAGYSSTCPTGRLSFKLYDWNPAEFPRTLRLQILEWLASMPIELEGYIRSGCTILTAFLAMPTSMWAKLLDEPLSYIHDLAMVPGSIFSGRGPMLIYLNNRIYRKNGSSITHVDVKEQAPRLHYVNPTCFEAGKPMEFTACGSNLQQKKFQFLISFGGRYLKYDSCVALSCGDGEEISGADHQTYRICIPLTDAHQSGPAFIEVENVSGLSNFYPILISDRDVCCEMTAIQQTLSTPSKKNASECEFISYSQIKFSELLLDVAWLLKKSSVTAIQLALTSTNIQRVTNLISYLQHHGSTIILDRVLQNLEAAMHDFHCNSTNYPAYNMELQSLRNHMASARTLLNVATERQGNPELYSGYNAPEETITSKSCVDSISVTVISVLKHVMKKTSYSGSSKSDSFQMIEDGRKSPALVGKDNSDLGFRLRSRSRPLRLFKSRMAILVICSLAVCLGVCAVALHPKKVSQLAIAIHSCVTHRINN